MSRAALVVGHGPGVGEACARAFAAQGRRVALIARDAARVEAAAQAIGDGAIGLPADAGDEAELVAALDRAAAALGPPGILLYNAAYWRSGPLLATTPDMLASDFGIDVAGALVASRWAAPKMVRGDALLFTGGGLALHPSADAPTLSIGKAAIRALALMLADELAPQGVRVGTVTIAGQVGPDGVSAGRVADAFLELASGAPDRSTAEVILRP